MKKTPELVAAANRPVQGTASPARRRARSRRRSAGVVMVEYTFLLVFFGIPVALATAAAGVQLIQGYGNVRNDVLSKGV